jgi:Putative adhesin
MMSPHRSLAGLLALLAATAVGAQQKFERRHAATKDVYVRVNGAFGSLRVTTWAHDSVAIVGDVPRGTRIDGGASEAPSKGIKYYFESTSGGPATGRIELQVPAGATVWAKAANAVIDVSGVTGGLDLNIIGGSVSVAGTPRELNVESMDGAVTITGSPGWMRVKTATGHISVNGSSPDAGFTTVGGTVAITHGDYERVRIESVTGNVSFAGTLRRAGSLTIDSHSGTIDLVLPAKASVDIEATTIAGTILNSVTARRPTPGREGRGEELSLGLGIGDARATLRSFKGNIRLTRREGTPSKPG